MNTVHNADCFLIMKDKPDNYYDLSICDPPYGIGAGDYKRGGTQYGKQKAACKNYHKYDDVVPPQIYFTELLRISKHVILWGANHFISKIPHDSPAWIVWDKQTTGNMYADAELAWTNFDCAVKIFSYRWAGMMQQKMGNKETRIHPNQKPVDLYKWVLQNYAKPGDKIFDSHVGSGSIRIACHNLGFSFEGTEIDPVYYNDQEERYKKHLQQAELFDKGEIQGLIFKDTSLSGKGSLSEGYI